MSIKGLQLDYEIADKITIANLRDQVAYLREEIRKHMEEGAYLHPEDLDDSQYRLIPAMEMIIKYYGG